MAFWVEQLACTKALRWEQPAAPEEAEGQEGSGVVLVIDRVLIG